jgi:adenylate cyclase
MRSQETELDKSEQIEFRIGINVGEVIHDRDDIYGDGVNIAARIQEVASPDGICISGAVWEQLTEDANYKFNDLRFSGLQKYQETGPCLSVKTLRFA